MAGSAAIHKHQEASVRRPVRPGPVLLHDGRGRSSVHADQANRARGIDIHDLLPVRGNGGAKDLPGRKRKLQGIRSVAAAAPQRVIGVGGVGDPLAVCGPGGIESVDAGEQREELPGICVVTDQLSPRLQADGKNLLPIPAGNGRSIGQRTIGELDRRWRAAQKPGLHRQDPDVGTPFMSVFVDNVAAIGRPASTAKTSGRAVPEEDMETGAVCLGLVDRDRAMGGRPDCEDQPLSVRGDARFHRETVDAEQFARLGAVLLGNIDVVSQAEENTPIREQVRILGNDGSEEAGFSTGQRDGPERKRERVARRAEQIGPVLAQCGELEIG